MSFLEARARYRRIAKRFPVLLPMRGYIVGKLALDPAFAAVRKEIAGSKLPVVDIGCGLGLLAHFLRDAGVNAPILGYDIDARKIALARRAASTAGLRDVTFEVGDAARALPDGAHVIALDVLHYLPPADQARLLSHAARLASPETRIIIRTTPRDGSWRYRITVAEEWWTRLSRWIPVDAPVNFPTAKEVVAPFQAAGCRARVRPLWGITPFNSHLFVFERPGVASPTATEAALSL